MTRPTRLLLILCALVCAATLSFPSAARAELTEEWGYDRRGADLRSFRAADLAGCQQACEQEAACQAYTFAVGANLCYLKRGPGSPQRRDGRVSGVKTAAAPQAPAGGELTEEWGYDRPGQDYRSFEAAILARCKRTCRREERCRAYSYNRRSRTCYLKADVPAAHPSDHYVTGYFDSAYRPATSELTQEPGYDYPGYDYDSFEAEHPEACRNACQEEERCRAYSYNQRSNVCYLKETAGARVPSPNTIAGSAGGTAAPAAPATGLTEEYGFDYRGNDYRSFRAPGLEPCKSTCLEEARCQAYTFNQRTGTCYLKDAAGYRGANRDTVTGTKTRG